MGIPEHLTCFLRNPYAGEEATVRIRHGTTKLPDWEWSMSRLYMLLLCLFKLYAEYIMQNARLDEAQAGIKVARRNINKLNMVMKSLLWKKAKKN